MIFIFVSLFVDLSRRELVGLFHGDSLTPGTGDRNPTEGRRHVGGDVHDGTVPRLGEVKPEEEDTEAAGDGEEDEEDDGTWRGDCGN